MKPAFTKILALCLWISITSCDRPKCQTTNPVFQSMDISSSSYKKELANEIQKIGMNNLRYWLADYFENNQEHYFVFYVQNKSLCAQAVIKADKDNPKLKQLIKKKGKGRFNAEFENMKFKINTDESGNTEFVYISHDRIID